MFRPDSSCFIKGFSRVIESGHFFFAPPTNYVPKEIMKNIVQNIDGKIYVSVSDISDFSDNDIRSVRKLINSQSEYFERIGLNIDSVSFKDFKSLSLTETQTNFLLMLMRNTENVVKFKLALSVQIEKLKNQVCDFNKQQLLVKEKQLKLSQKETNKAKRKAYGHTRVGNYQCATNILKDVDADISSEVFNKILLSQGYLSQKEVLAKKYFPNNRESILSDDGNILIHYDTAINVLENFDVGFKKDDQLKMEF